MKLKSMLCAVLAVVAFAIPSATSEEAKPKAGDALIQIGVGAAATSYPGTINTAMDYLVSYYGMTRVTIGLNANIGVAFNENAYIVIGINGIGDRLSKGAEYFQINQYLYHGGLRYYPAVSGFYLQGMYGFSKMVTQSGGSSSSTVSESTSPIGSGFGGALGYEFGSAKGFGLGLEASVLRITIEGDSVLSGSVMFNLRWR